MNVCEHDWEGKISADGRTPENEIKCRTCGAVGTVSSIFGVDTATLKVNFTVPTYNAMVPIDYDATVHAIEDKDE